MFEVWVDKLFKKENVALYWLFAFPDFFKIIYIFFFLFLLFIFHQNVKPQPS